MTEQLLEELQGTKDTYSFFREKMKVMKNYQFFDYYDYELIHKWFEQNRPYDEYKMFVCLCEKDFNQFIHSIKDKENVLTYFLKNNELYYSLFTYSDLASLKIFLEQLKDNKKLEYCNLSFLSAIRVDIVNEYINNTTDMDNIALLANYNYGLQKSFFLNHSMVALELLNEKKIPISTLLHDDVKISSEILKSNILFDGIKSPNIIGFRNNFDKIINLNPSIYLEQKLNDYEDEIILNFDMQEGLLNQYKGLTEFDYFKLSHSDNDNYLFNRIVYEQAPDDLFEEYLKQISKKKLFELIIDRLFKDNYYNVLINIKEMFRYNEQQEPLLIKEEHIAFYSKIVEFANLSDEEKISLFKKYKDSNINTTFYEDIRKCMNDSYDKMIGGLYHPKVKNEELSKYYDTDIYLLDGADFTMMIRGLNGNYSSDEIFKKYRECFSLISEDNTSRFSYGENYCYYGYTNINTDDILHVSEDDSFSGDEKNGTKKINRIMTSQEITSYEGISEIQIKTNDGIRKPDYIVAFNEITERNLMDARIKYSNCFN